MRQPLRSLALAVLAAAWALPALADTPFAMSGAYQKIGSAGASVDVQNTSSTAVQLLTAGSQPASTSPGQVLVGGDHRCWTLSADLYALGNAPGQVMVTTGVTCGGGGGGGGSGGTVNQGTAGASPWPVSWTNQSVAVSSLPAITGSVAVSNFPATQPVSGSVGVTALPALPAGTNQIGALLDNVEAPSFPASGGSVSTVFNTAGYGSAQASITGGFVATLIPEVSNDNTNWQPQAVSGTLSGGGSISDLYVISVPGLYSIPATAPYMRLRVGNYTSGTVNADVRLRSAPAPAKVANALVASRIPSAAASTNLTVAKNAAGRAFKVYGCNTAASPRFIKLYNAASGVTVGTTPVAVSREFPPSSCSSFDWADVGFLFTGGISYALTAGSGLDTDTNALTAGDLVQVSVEYQ